MSSAPHQRRPDPFVRQGPRLASLLGVAGDAIAVTFRGTRVHALASQDAAGQRRRADAPFPVTDLLHLELLTGAGEAPEWPRPVALHALVEARADPLLAVRRASRWASYAARVALVDHARLSGRHASRAVLEAGFLGVWVVAVTADGDLQVAAPGEPGPVSGSARGLLHRLLDELTWAALS